MVRTYGRSFGRCTVKWLQNFLGWVRFTDPWCCAGGRESSTIIKVNYLIHWMEWKQVDIAILHRKLGYLSNLDLCCVTRECLLFFSLKLAGERLKHCFKCVSDTSVLGTFMLTLPLCVPCMLSCEVPFTDFLYMYTWLLAYYGGCNLDNKQLTIKKLQTYNFCSLDRLENIPNGSCSIWFLYSHLQE